MAIVPHSDADPPSTSPTEAPARPARPRLAVLLSGSGRTLGNLLAASRDGRLPADIAAVVSSRPDVRGVEVAIGAGLPVAIVERPAFPDAATFSHAIYGWLAPHAPDLIVLAGFLKRLDVPDEWAGRILNIHPGLLSTGLAAGRGFHGERVHAAVLAAGATETGATVHVVDDEYDHGPTVLERRVAVQPGDTAETLAARVFSAECQLYPEAIAAYLHDNPWIAGSTE